MNSRINKPLIYLIVSAFVFSLLWGYLVYWQIYAQHGYPSDLKQHIGFAREKWENALVIPHFLWHSTVGWIHQMLRISYEAAAWWVSYGIFIGLITVVVGIIRSKLISFDFSLQLFVFISVMVIAPFYVYGLSHFIYLGVGSPSVWHNITLMSVKFIGLVTLVVTLKAFRSDKHFWYSLSAGLLIISMLAKPSFMMIFLPALTVWIVIRGEYESRKIGWLLIFWMSALFVLIWQAAIVNDDNNRIIIDFLGVWSINNYNILWAIISALMFPLIYLGFDFKRLYDDDYLLVSWGMVFSGLIIAMLFAESGERYLHGNFMWGYSLGMFYLYLFAIVSFVKYYRELIKIKRYILNIVLLYQTGVGLYYFGKILYGESIV